MPEVRNSSHANRVPTPEAALQRLDLPPDRRIVDLSPEQLRSFHRLIGWEPGGPVIEYPTAPERKARQRRERWKEERAGRGRKDPCLLIRAENIATFRANAERDPATTRWYRCFLTLAAQLAELPLSTFAELVPAQPPWNVAGSYCPHCVGDQSDYTIHHPFWRWSPLEPEQIQCPHCGTVYPHSDYPEEGRIELPRLGVAYTFYLSPEDLADPDWRMGHRSSRFGGGPTQVSFSGEIRRCALAWILGQIEPLGIAHALTGNERYADIAATILLRLAEVYPHYPVYSYRQEYSDADPAYAIERVDDLPAPFKRAAFHYTYTGRWKEQTDLHSKERTTTSISSYPNGEWGTSRLGREKASNGQLFLSLFEGYDLIKQNLTQDQRLRIERDFLLELYLDTKGLSKRIDNKAGPGAASRVAVGVFYDDPEEIEEGVSQFRQVVAGQFYADGTWKETPIYGAKSLFEGMACIPELLRGRIDLYAGPLYRSAFSTYARACTPLGTQPALGDSPVDYALQTYLADLARIRLGIELPPRLEGIDGFDLLKPQRAANNSGYVAGLESLALDESEGRHFADGPIGFAAVGHIHRRVRPPSIVSMFGERRSERSPLDHPALDAYYEGRGLACLGWGEGPTAVQLYINGDDGRRGHRHADPLNLTLFAAGRELFPDLGYIADHPANAWIRSTPAHNTVAVDNGSVIATGPGILQGWEIGDGWRFCDLSVPVALQKEDRSLARYRRAVLALHPTDDDLLLIDLFDVEGGQTHDYLIRVNDPERRFQIPQLPSTPRSEPLFQAVPTPPFDFRTAGPAAAPFSARWGNRFIVKARALSPCDELIHFQSPAWRNSPEVFEDPQRSWDTLCLRRSGGSSRFLVVYEVAPQGKTLLANTDIHQLRPDVIVQLKTVDAEWAIEIGAGHCRVRRLPL